MRAPLCIDLFSGLGGWTDGFLAEGWNVVGFDIERHVYGDQKYPAQLVLQDVLTIHGSQFRNADCIVASPPCQNYSYLAMPWSRSKSEHSQKAKALRRKWETEGPDNRLFDACFRIQREAIDAAGRFIPLIVENVRGAQPWVGRSAWNYGSFHLWGDVPALMPINLKRAMKRNPDGTAHPRGSWFAIADSSQGDRRDGSKNTGGSWFNIGSPGQKETNRNPVHELSGLKTPGRSLSKGAAAKFGTHNMNSADKIFAELGGTKIGGDWFSDPQSTSRKHGSRSEARKAASAMIAKIPFELSSHIARVYKPQECAA